MAKVNKKAEKLLAELQKDFGEEAVMMLSDVPPYEVVSSGSLSLDFAIGIGGFPNNRCVEIVGEEGLGKSTLAILTMKKFLDAYPDKMGVILDLEHKLSASWVEQLVGADNMERIILTWPSTAEDATDMYVKACRSESVSICIFDSIGGAPSQRVTEKSATIGNIGGNALAITRFAQMAAIHSDKYKVLTIGINQIREDTEGYHRLITPGGRGWKHACITRIQLKKVTGEGTVFYDVINGERTQVGYTIKAYVFKNQLAPPYRTAQWNFYNIPCKYGFGVDTAEECERLSVLTGVVRKDGSYYYHEGLPKDGKVYGAPRFKEALQADPAFRAQIIQQTLDKLKSGDVDMSAVAPLAAPGEFLTEDGEEVSPIGKIFSMAQEKLGG